ncbi:MAG: 50S ribosomal protein L3 [Clostridiales Family XIII bacterium]|jgi:large subunit ribosomal protein L3|nr:50S ribosomal protein L3 [Clostridiales Family XIII bacterium]
MATTILGKKVGMTQIFTEDGNLVPVTVIEAGPVTVTQVKTVENDGYSAVQIGFGDLKDSRANKPAKGHFERWGVPLKKHLTEIRLGEGESYEAGQVITVEDFAVGSYLDVTGVSKGKGTQGNIKRHGHHRGPMTHGSKHKRLAGALAAGTYPSRVFKGNAGPGRMGRETVTVQNLELVGIVPERNAMLVKGAAPGRRGGLLKIRYAVKKEAPAPAEAIEREAAVPAETSE